MGGREGGGKINADKRRIELPANRSTDWPDSRVHRSLKGGRGRTRLDADHGKGERAQDSWAGLRPIDRSRCEEREAR